MLIHELVRARRAPRTGAYHALVLSLINISEPTRPTLIWFCVFCL
jgi:hypothetical protein